MQTLILPIKLAVCTGVLFSAFVLTHNAQGALLYLDPADAEVSRGDTITLAVRVDTDEGECINTADVVVEYDDSVRAVDVSRGESILSVWLEEPVIDVENRRITFAGGIPGGYCGRIQGDPRLTNVLAELVFRLPGFNVGGSEPTAAVTFHDSTRVLLNDGFGTDAPLRISGATLELLDRPAGETADDWSERIAEDEIPPADFSISLNREENAFSGKYFIVFDSRDKQSGIDRYEVMEEPFEEFYLFKWGGVDAPWVRAESPYVLKDQTLNSTIRVRAIDKAGNEAIATLVPEPALRSASREKVTTIAVVLLIGVILAVGIGYGVYRRKKNLIEEYEHNDDETV